MKKRSGGMKTGVAALTSCLVVQGCFHSTWPCLRRDRDQPGAGEKHRLGRLADGDSDGRGVAQLVAAGGPGDVAAGFVKGYQRMTATADFDQDQVSCDQRRRTKAPAGPLAAVFAHQVAAPFLRAGPTVEGVEFAVGAGDIDRRVVDGGGGTRTVAALPFHQHPVGAGAPQHFAVAGVETDRVFIPAVDVHRIDAIAGYGQPGKTLPALNPPGLM